MSESETPKMVELAADEISIVRALSQDDIAQIDRWVVESATNTFQKVAMIVAKAIEASDLAERLLDVPDTYFAIRIAALAAKGVLESQGDPLYMRHSEARLASTEAQSAPSCS